MSHSLYSDRLTDRHWDSEKLQAGQCDVNMTCHVFTFCIAASGENASWAAQSFQLQYLEWPLEERFFVFSVTGYFVSSSWPFEVCLSAESK